MKAPSLTEKEDFLADMSLAIQSRPDGAYFPGYPPAADRLVMSDEQLCYTADGHLILPADPAAPYTVFNLPAKPGTLRSPQALWDDGGRLPAAAATHINWDDMGRDARGFPLHRFATDMLTDPNIGIVVGAGYFWHPGKVRTADLGALALGVAATEPDEHGMTLIDHDRSREFGAGSYLGILLVQRADTGQFALPGGRVDTGEAAIVAAARELAEETGVHIRPEQLASQGSRLVADPRLTACTEISTELFTVHLSPFPAQRPGPSDETLASAWYVADRRLTDPAQRHRFFGSHWRLILESIDWYQEEYGVHVDAQGKVTHLRSSK